MAGKSISNPARKKRNPSPNLARTWIVGPAAAHPNTCGPTRIPKPISATTKGSRISGSHSHKKGATAGNGKDQQQRMQFIQRHEIDR
jgi:hypothetical protein